MTKLETGMHYPLKLDALPANWCVGYVGDFAEEIQPGFASGKHNKDGAGIPHIRPYNIDRQGKLDLSVIKSVAPESDVKRLKTDDVLFNNTNSPELIGKTALISSAGDWGFSNHMTRIRFKDGVVPKYAAYQLHFLWMTGYYLHNCVKHVNQASISSKTLANAVPFIAPPLDQQKRIVAEIEKQFSRLDEAVANLKRVKANLKRYKAAVLKAAVEGRLVETEAELARREGRSYETGEQLLQRILETRRSQWKGKGKYKEPAAPDTTDLPELPEGWVWATVGGLGDVIGGLTKNPKRVRLPRKLPYLRVANVYANELRLDEIEEIGVEDSELEKLLVHKGDLLIVEGNGSPDQIGRLAIWDGSICPCVHQNHLIKVRLPRECISEWVVSWLMSVEGRQYVRDVASSTSGLYTLSVGKVAGLPVPLPPITEQYRIVAEVDRRISLVRETEAQVDVNLKRAERLRQSILSRAFSGGLIGDRETISADAAAGAA